MPRGGAVAVWAPGSVGYPAGHARLLDAFYAAVFRDDERVLGAAVAAAQREVLAEDRRLARAGRDVQSPRRSGYAAPFPPTRPYVVATVPAAGATDVAVDEPLVVTFNKRMDPAALSVSALRRRHVPAHLECRPHACELSNMPVSSTAAPWRSCSAAAMPREIRWCRGRAS